MEKTFAELVKEARLAIALNDKRGLMIVLNQSAREAETELRSALEER